MKYKKLKFTTIAIVAIFAAIASLRPFETVSAQKTKTNILALASKYKTWERPVKPTAPQNRPLEPGPVPPAGVTVAKADTFEVSNSSGFG